MLTRTVSDQRICFDGGEIKIKNGDSVAAVWATDIGNEFTKNQLRGLIQAAEQAIEWIDSNLEKDESNG